MRPIYLLLMLVAFALPTQAQESDVFNPIQFKNHTVVPTLDAMNEVFPGSNNPAAVNLMIGIAYHESKGGTYLRQVGNSGGVVLDGGLGIYQVEAETHTSIYEHYLRYDENRMAYAKSLLPVGAVKRITVDAYELDHEALVRDLQYATFVARVLIYKSSFHWPEDPRDVRALAKIWDEKYNRNPRAGHVHQYVNDFPRSVLG